MGSGVIVAPSARKHGISDEDPETAARFVLAGETLDNENPQRGVVQRPPRHTHLRRDVTDRPSTERFWILPRHDPILSTTDRNETQDGSPVHRRQQRHNRRPRNCQESRFRRGWRLLTRAGRDQGCPTPGRELKVWYRSSR
ncbi:hypothetical protein EII34_14790 [Arachnia propionica]|uniref:Uncharacterized protein n=1 Tax=Arachnia propionica TaxID=1750 RepID=A0A3P1T195_9ACTN|nr:hypothetical protein EII34_14790 [Arachnia propionica]